MRRSEKEVTGLENILAILKKCETIRIGLCLDNMPYIVPMNFAYEVVNEKVFIYLHCASKGKKMDIIAVNDNVCFEADCSYQTVQAEEACKWSAAFESIMGEGQITALADKVQKEAALDLLMRRYGAEEKPHYKPEALEAVTVLKISASSLTGKRSIVPIRF